VWLVMDPHRRIRASRSAIDSGQLPSLRKAWTAQPVGVSLSDHTSPIRVRTDTGCREISRATVTVRPSAGATRFAVSPVWSRMRLIVGRLMRGRYVRSTR